MAVYRLGAAVRSGAGVLVQVLDVVLRIRRVRNHEEREPRQDLRDDARVSVLASAQRGSTVSGATPGNNPSLFNVACKAKGRSIV